MSEWQTIDSAPKDDTRFLGYGKDRYGEHHVSVTYYSGSKFRDEWTKESEVDSDGYGWSGHGKWEPTHWMPLPKPPEVIA